MRTREKQRIFKRFMEGESCDKIALSMWEQVEGFGALRYEMIEEVEQAIRSCVWDEIKKGEKK